MLFLVLFCVKGCFFFGAFFGEGVLFLVLFLVEGCLVLLLVKECLVLFFW